ncbi:MAG: hypothetical protein V2G42_02445 [bacterium JZ-2024 1]
MPLRKALVLVLFVFAMVSLSLALITGLLRAGWLIPVWNYRLVSHHSLLMVSGFFGLIITLERAVASRWHGHLVAPLLAAGGTLCLIAGLPQQTASFLYGASSAILVTAYLSIFRRDFGLHAIVMEGGALCWTIATILMTLGYPAVRVSLLWVAFLVLTIVGERLELSRAFFLKRRARGVLASLAVVVSSSAVLAVFSAYPGHIFGLALAGISGWLLRYDPTPRLWRQSGVVRYSSICLTTGFVWLGISGLLFFAHPVLSSSLRFDAAIHAVFLGFVFSMVMGHFPMIAPALLAVTPKFTHYLYLPVIFFHLSVLVRIVSGWTLRYSWHRWALLANAASLLLFFVISGMSLVLRQNQERGRFHPAP